MPRVLFFILILLYACGNSVQEVAESDSSKDASTRSGAVESEYKTYYLAFLKEGVNREQDSAEVLRIQNAHIAYMSKLSAEGKLSISGPFMDDWETRGMIIYAVDSMSEARALANADPAVEAGRLTIEIHPWKSTRGSSLP